MNTQQVVLALGCGFFGMLISPDNPIGLNERASKHFTSNPQIVDSLIYKGVPIAILAEDHADKKDALAVNNTAEGMTVDTVALNSEGVQVYVSDEDTVKLIINGLAEVASEIDQTWGDNIRNEGFKTYKQWLSKATNALAGMDPVEI